MAEKYQFIAFHGWGFDSSFWQSWKDKLSEFGTFQTYDRGYFGEPNYLEWDEDDTLNVLITHSYGLHFLDKTMLERADILIITSGFLYFHPHAAQYKRRSRLIVQEMINQLQRKPEQVVQEFYKNSFAPEKSPEIDFENMNIDLLHKDLERLKESNFNVKLLKKAQKVCILHGSKDRIVSNRKGRRLHNELRGISKYFEIKDAGHAMPFTHATQCTEFVIPEIRNISKIYD